MGPIYGQNAVQVVDFVLEKFGSVSLEVDLMEVSFEVLVTDPDPVGPLDSDQQVGERKAVIPDRKVLGADVDDFRVDQGPRPVHLDVNDPDGSPDLGPGNPPAGSEAGLPIPKGISEIVDNHPDRSGARLGYRLTSGPKDRVSEKSNSMNGHVT